MKYFFLLGFLQMGIIIANAQNIVNDTVKWNVAKAVNQADNSEIVSDSYFITNSNNTVDWIQKGVSSHYNVDQVDGTWSSVVQDGSITYKISTAWGLAGSITFSRDSGQLKIHLKTQVEGADGLDLSFLVSSIQ